MSDEEGIYFCWREEVGNMKNGVTVAVIFIVTMVLSFLITAGWIKVICWAFNLAFSWKVSIGIWAVLFIARSVFRASK